MTAPFVRLARGWHEFWFRPQSTATLALFRIAFGLVTTFWTLSFLPLLGPFFGAGAAIPEGGSRGIGVWSVFTITGLGLGPAVVVWLVLLVASVALTLGYQTRLASVLVFVGLLALLRHTPYASNTGDALFRVLAFYLMFAPAGDALSLDRWRSDRERFWECPERSPWALRLMQIQMSVLYLSTVWDKIQGDTWRNGTAVSYALRVVDVQRFPSPTFLTDSLALTQLMTLGTLALEICLGILVWNRAARPWVLTLGALMHLSIEFSITVGFFSLIMLVLYVTFVPPERADQLVAGVRVRVVRRRRRGAPEEPREQVEAADTPVVSSAR